MANLPLYAGVDSLPEGNSPPGRGGRGRGGGSRGGGRGRGRGRGRGGKGGRGTAGKGGRVSTKADGRRVSGEDEGDGEVVRVVRPAGKLTLILFEVRACFFFVSFFFVTLTS